MVAVGHQERKLMFGEKRTMQKTGVARTAWGKHGKGVRMDLGGEKETCGLGKGNLVTKISGRVTSNY